MTLAGLAPHTLQVAARGQLLRPAVLEREVAQLAALGRAAVARAEPLGGAGDLARAPREGLEQASRHARDLEVLAVLAGAPLDRIALPGQLLGERGAVERAQLPRRAEDRPRGDRDDPVVLPHRAGDDDMAVQLRVGRLRPADPARGRVPVLGRDHVLGVLLHDLAVVAAAHHRHLLAQIRDALLDGPGVRGLDLLALPRIAERPHDRHGLRGAERHVDPAAPAAAGARPTQPLARLRVAAFHQRDEVRALDRLARLDPEPRERLRVGEPPARGLRQLAVRGQVVVAALGRDRLALQVARVAATSAAGMLAAVITQVMTLSGPKRPTNCTALAHQAHTRAYRLYWQFGGGAEGRGSKSGLV